MGTEIYFYCIIQLFYFVYSVKLNNPLMGTEIPQLTAIPMSKIQPYFVKLNNPLMGTEISIHFEYEYKETEKWLN